MCYTVCGCVDTWSVCAQRSSFDDVSIAVCMSCATSESDGAGLETVEWYEVAGMGSIVSVGSQKESCMVVGIIP